MKFLQGFFGILALAAGLIYVGLTVLIGTVASFLLLAAGVGLLALDILALAIWFVDWKYYS